MPDEPWTFKIDKGIPIPGHKNLQKNNRDAIRWAELQIGDSFLWKGSSSGLKKRAEAAGIKITIKLTKHEKLKNQYGAEEEFRIWRTE